MDFLLCGFAIWLIDFISRCFLYQSELGGNNGILPSTFSL
nr:MAG TPA: cell cycle inhibiting factor [Caudoviricetes sp.]